MDKSIDTWQPRTVFSVRGGAVELTLEKQKAGREADI